MAGSDKRRTRRPSTLVAHAGRDPFAHHGFVNPPVYRGSTVLFKSRRELREARAALCLRPARHAHVGRAGGRHRALEGGARTWLAPSGAAAIATALLSFTKAGDHILVPDTAYLPTRKMCDGVLKRFGVETTYYDPTDRRRHRQADAAEHDAGVHREPGSQTFEVQDIPAIAAAAHAAAPWW